MATRTWTGAAGDFDLSNLANYDGAVPVTGDELLFSLRSVNSPTKSMSAFYGVRATGTLTLAENVANAETVTIDTKTYTYRATITEDSPDGDVLIGGTASDSLDNLIAAIILGAGEGTTYAKATTVHLTVLALAGAGDTMDVTARNGGTDDNTTATTETLDGVGNQWGGATLSGGSNTGFTLALLFAGDDSNVAVGQASNPIRTNTLTKAVNQGQGSMHIRADTITRAICNSDHPKTEPAMVIDDTTTLTALVCVKGRIVVGPDVTTLTRVLSSFRDSRSRDVELVIDEAAGAIAEYRQVGGIAELNRLPTLCSLEDGRLTILDTAPANTVTRIEVIGRSVLNYNNTQTVTRVNVFDGTFDVTGITNKLTITNIAVWPNARFLRSDDLVTYGGGAVLVDLTGGDV